MNNDHGGSQREGEECPRGPNGFTVEDVIDLLDDSMPDGAWLAIGAEYYGGDYMEWIDALAVSSERGEVPGED